MKLLIICLCTLLAACESTTALQNASQKGLGAMSCVEINNIFGAVERDRYTVEAAKQLGLAINIPYQAGTEVKNYYEMARTAANVALLAQGCQPLSY